MRCWLFIVSCPSVFGMPSSSGCSRYSRFIPVNWDAYLHLHFPSFVVFVCLFGWLVLFLSLSLLLKIDFFHILCSDYGFPFSNSSKVLSPLFSSESILFLSLENNQASKVRVLAMVGFLLYAFCVLCFTLMCIHWACAVPMEGEENFRSWAAATEGYDLSCGCWKLNSGSLEEQPVLSTWAISRVPEEWLFKWFCDLGVSRISPYC